jgi:uncharacterized protein
MTAPLNQLQHERSPYLLQHANNPVAWMPWCDAAFERARSENKPIFLSIGYSACHWCHVMEHESFEDHATAVLLNEHFVSVKVDREERPDIDQVYQLAHQAITQRSGGWPLSMFLTADRKPFFGGTYFPNKRRHGMPSFSDVLHGVLDAWRDRHGDVLTQASDLAEVLSHATSTIAKNHTTPSDVVLTAVQKILPRIDRAFGGFGGAPKFPNVMALELLAAVSTRNLQDASASAREGLAITLDRMARGGIWDHLGEGFSRYSTDVRWHVPHFEKMLYDNGLLARIYLDGMRCVRENDAITPQRCETVVRGIFSWLSREMTSPEGAFYSAQDADSDGEEGRFFVWDLPEVTTITGNDTPAICAWYDVTPEGNWEHGHNVLWTPRPLGTVARSVGLSETELTNAIERGRSKLWQYRELRNHPLCDTKCLASWNALVISALADAGATFGDSAYIRSALRCLFLWRDRAFTNTHLAHAIKDNTSYGHGFLDDYAGMACAALDVYEATFDPAALMFARQLMNAVLERFIDTATHQFFFTPSDGEVVLFRSRDPFDHAAPGGAGLAIRALVRLAELTETPQFVDASERVVAAYASITNEHPLGVATISHACDRAWHRALEVIVVGDLERSDTQAMILAARSVYIPHRMLVCVRDATHAQEHGISPALLEGRVSVDGAPVAFVCRGATCELPVHTPEALRTTLQRVVCVR